MRVLAFEYITGGGMLQEPLPEFLAEEGDQMLRALAADLNHIETIDVVVMRDIRLPALAISAKTVWLKPADDFQTIWQRVLKLVDAVWPVAPETGGILEAMTTDILNAGKILLNSSPEAVRLTTSKSRTLAHLAENDIAVVPSYTNPEKIPEDSGRWIVKPDDGVGCEDLIIFNSLEQAKTNTHSGLFQPYLSGIDASLSVICHAGKATLLSVNRQHILPHGNTLHLLHCEVNAITENKTDYAQLANQIAAAIPGLWGYVGIDLLICKDDILVLEINPRLTVSYASLSTLLNMNPAREVLNLLSQPGQITYENGVIKTCCTN